MCGNWIEIAYGTSSGTVRVIVQHPETVGHGPQLFQTFTVHRFSVTKVLSFLPDKFLFFKEFVIKLKFYYKRCCSLNLFNVPKISY